MHSGRPCHPPECTDRGGAGTRVNSREPLAAAYLPRPLPGCQCGAPRHPDTGSANFATSRSVNDA